MLASAKLDSARIACCGAHAHVESQMRVRKTGSTPRSTRVCSKLTSSDKSQRIRAASSWASTVISWAMRKTHSRQLVRSLSSVDEQVGISGMAVVKESRKSEELGLAEQAIFDLICEYNCWNKNLSPCKQQNTNVSHVLSKGKYGKVNDLLSIYFLQWRTLTLVSYI